MKKLGLQQGSHVALLSENCADWLICDQACLLSGFVNAIRGSGCAVTELSLVVLDNRFDELRDISYYGSILDSFWWEIARNYHFLQKKFAD